jgi:RNA ligase
MAARQDNPEEGLALWCYQSRCVFNDGWNEFTTLARGLILDAGTGRIVATPFPKFFNYGERGEEFPALPFETFEKLDGSLIILFHHRGRWLTATKGSFNSPQARWAQIDGVDPIGARAWHDLFGGGGLSGKSHRCAVRQRGVGAVERL